MEDDEYGWMDSEYEMDEDDHDPGDDCGRWDNGKIGRQCRLAGTEFCDFECPFR